MLRFLFFFADLITFGCGHNLREKELRTAPRHGGICVARALRALPGPQAELGRRGPEAPS